MNKSEIAALAQEANVGEDAVAWLSEQLGIGGQTAAATVVNPSPTVLQLSKGALAGLTVTHKFFVYADAGAKKVEYWPIEGSRLQFLTGEDRDTLQIRSGQDVIEISSGRKVAHGDSAARLHEYVRNRIINQRRN